MEVALELVEMEPCTSGANPNFSDPESESEMKRLKTELREFQVKVLNVPREVVDSGNASTSAGEVALGIDLILLEIFKNLSPGELRNCCEVNERWRDIAGPMIFDYHLYFDERLDIRVKTTRGYLNPRIERRCFSVEAETKFLEAQKCGVAFISLQFSECSGPWRRYDQEMTHKNRDFVKKFGRLVYKLDCYDGKSMDKFFLSSENYQRKRNILRGMRYFPNCEEFRSRKLRSFDWFSHLNDYYYSMDHLKRLYLGSMGMISALDRSCFTCAPIFLTMPSIQQIHGVPFSTLSNFQGMKKLHLVYSIHFHVELLEHVELSAMRTMVQLGLNFRFLRIGYKKSKWEANSKFIERNKEQFEELLELGKDTLESVVLFLNTKENQINFPTRMSALTHITFRKGSPAGSVHFLQDFSFAERFPKLDTISFMPRTLMELEAGDTWWGNDGMPGTSEYLKGIKNLKCYKKLGKWNEGKLLQRFPSVNRIEYLCNIDDTEVDGIISH